MFGGRLALAITVFGLPSGGELNASSCRAAPKVIKSKYGCLSLQPRLRQAVVKRCPTVLRLVVKKVLSTVNQSARKKSSPTTLKLCWIKSRKTVRKYCLLKVKLQSRGKLYCENLSRFTNKSALIVVAVNCRPAVLSCHIELNYCPPKMQMLNAQKLETDVSKVRAKLSAGDGHSGLQVTVGKLLIGGLPGLRLTFNGLP